MFCILQLLLFYHCFYYISIIEEPLIERNKENMKQGRYTIFVGDNKQ